MKNLNNILNMFFSTTLLFVAFNSASWLGNSNIKKDYFSCQLSNNKLISLSGTEDEKGGLISLQYQAFKRNKIEFLYPENEANTSVEQFNYNHYARYQTDYLTISFQNNGYHYSIFEYRENAKHRQGIEIYLPQSEKTITYDCKKVIKNDLLNLSKKLSCDEENALGCAEN